MKRQKIHLLTIAVILLSSACSKPIEPVESEFSFTYKGKDYYYTSFQDSVGVLSKGLGSIYIRKHDFLGGYLYFDIGDCAYLAPEDAEVSIGGLCTLSILKNGMPIPIDSSIYTYQSGHLNLSISDCGSGNIQGWTFTTCMASGTFDLTLMNQNNETIELTDGIINNFMFFY